MERLALHAMATRFELVLLGADPVFLRAAGEEALEEIRETERELSRFDPASLLSHVQREAPRRWVRVPGTLFACLRTCVEVHRASGGAFEPCLPGGTLAALELDTERSAVRLHAPDLQLDLGGVGKGTALDRAARALRDAGVEGAFLHGGTSTALALGAVSSGAGAVPAVGADPLERASNASGWRVAIRGSDVVVELRERALSVSALEQAGVAHIRTRSGTAVVRAAVRAASAELADAWSTALVAGADPSSLPSGVEALALPPTFDSSSSSARPSALRP